ncbi:MAG: hypothetical protein OES46_00175 [Gammaproteobacteria bacterium]|nr:hypothetical protein [Gammaproteobacteria bacterium]
MIDISVAIPLSVLPNRQHGEGNHHALLPNPRTRRLQPNLRACIAEALYDVDSIVADPGAYTKEELASLHSQILSNREQAWELLGGSEDQLLSTMMQISQVVTREFTREK